MSIIGFLFAFLSGISALASALLGTVVQNSAVTDAFLYAAPVIALLGLIFSIIGCKLKKHRGLAIAGIVLNILLLILYVAIVLFIIYLFKAIAEGIAGGCTINTGDGEEMGAILSSLFI